MSIQFNPPKSLWRFVQSEKFISFAVGPYGSTKTSAGIMKIAYMAKRVAAGRDGVRRSRAVWVRNCYDPETEILTPNGWVRFDELPHDAPVATLVNDALVWEVPRLHYAAEHKGKMIGLRSQGYDLLVTPDHELWLSKRRGRAKQWGEYERTKAHSVYGLGGTLRMRAVADYHGGDTSRSVAECEFLGFWMAEGSAGVYPREGGGQHYRLNVSQNPREDRYVESLLEACGYRYGVSVKNNGVGRLYALGAATEEEKARVREFAGYGKAATKKLPDWIKQANRERALAFIRGYQHGDGTFFGAHDGAVARLRTISPQLADDLQHMAILAGYAPTISWRADASAPHKLPMASVTLHHGDRHHPVVQKKHWYTVENYDGVVHCVEVSSGVVLVRRNGKAVWCGQTREQLNDTSIPDFLKWFPPGQAGDFLKTGLKFILRFDDVECEVLFRGLDDANDVRRLLSLQLTFGVMDEFREINPAVYEALTGRVGRYPDGMMVPHRPEWGVTERGDPVQGCVTDTGAPADAVWGMSNPPDADTYWERLLSEPPENVHVTIQPSGLSEEADWLHFLKPGYYDNLAVGKSQDWIDVYIHAKFGRSLSGQPVFPGFVEDFHVAKESLKPVVSTAHPLVIGLDFGLTPSCTINQQDPRGRFLTFAELTSENMGIVRFVREKLKPLLANKFPGHPVIVIGDPAGVQRVQTDERTVFDVLRAEGFRTIPAKTNSIAARIAAVEGLLAGQVDGGPMHIIDPSCTSLIRALRTGYRYKVKTNGEMEDKPEKNSYSHLVDGHEYACLHVDASGVGRGMTMGGGRRVAAPVTRVSPRGWT